MFEKEREIVFIMITGSCLRDGFFFYLFYVRGGDRAVLKTVGLKELAGSNPGVCAFRNRKLYIKLYV